MFDLGTSFTASVARNPDALAIVDGEVRLSYAQWLARISSLVAAFDGIGLEAGDHFVTVLQNRWEAASLHWACQFAGLIMTPINWRAKPDEIDFVLENAGAKAIAFEAVSAAAIAESMLAASLPRIAVGSDAGPADFSFAQMIAKEAPTATPRAGAEDWSLMLYTSGTTAKPKGVPRRHRAERMAAFAHVAQNLYGNGECTLGVMPLYHTMGVRSLLAMSLIGGSFVCLPRFDAARALELIEAERVSNLYLVPTLYHDVVHHPRFAGSDVSSVRKLGFAGAPMTDGLLGKLTEAFKPELFVNHYGSSEIYTFTIDQNAAAKPGCAGKAGLNQLIRVVRLGAASATELARPGEEGEIIALAASDEAFEGYWRRPEADAKSLRDGWYFTGDTGYFDGDGDLFVTGRVDDMIITGGENVSPVDIESCLSLHPAVSEVAVVGLPDERWGKIVVAFVQRASAVSAEELDRHCKVSGLANFKRPRRYEFVKAIPKSPVGKLLRRQLVAGEYEAERPDLAAE
ncbi:AMP-binding protein [Bosea sp. (in: a-proteobacteria)]|jgi:2-furoate---CoA ligase|uniref:AMP-binding protein n=1 Tax=Bosea sp. (in: a-proteobacteria) TaxID=1871050 RepID=UPI002DDD7223|nr:AMP-binding protein [Bosea sp. (in: a-proteobacteria)]HEV2510500.1 AMP-binding protein [Bosea sp. (in: a-proteobacteria)]